MCSPLFHSPYFVGGLYWDIGNLPDPQREQHRSLLLAAETLVFDFRSTAVHTYYIYAGIYQYMGLLGLFRAGSRRVHWATSPVQCGKVGALRSERRRMQR